MTVTATEFKTNLGKYLDIISDEDVLITKNGKVIAQLSKPQLNKIAAIRSLIGIADNGSDVSLDDIRAERLKRQ
ncbi:MAG: type II toxin-antitoxin system Phd/YefM family antitoxin [Clostridiales bacterium]|nr:type II toxin-antitoxin system Phd/YefM family antitoxin [Clostridiales bacterium]